MALTVLRGSGTIANGATATLTPPVGKTWILAVELGVYGIQGTIGGANNDEYAGWRLTMNGTAISETGDTVLGGTGVARRGYVTPKITTKVTATNALPLTMRYDAITSGVGAVSNGTGGYHYTGFEI